MRTCAQGHENPDDATRCSVCFRRLDATPVTVDLTVAERARVTAGGESTSLPLVVEQRQGETTRYTVEVVEPGRAVPAAHVEPVPPVVTLAPGSPVEVQLRVSVAGDVATGDYPVQVRLCSSPDDEADASAEVVLDVVAAEAPAPAPDPTPGPAPAPEPAPQPEPPAPPLPLPLPLPVPQPPGPDVDDDLHDDRREDARRDDERQEDPDGGRPDGRRVALVLAVVAAVAAVGVVVAMVIGDGGDDDDGPEGTVTAQEALAMSPAEARPLLEGRHEADSGRRSALLAAPGWLVQLSSKCSSFQEVDLIGGSQVGVPDGVPEAFPGGMGDNGVLAFHLGAREHWGDTVVLLRGEELGRDTCADGEPRWLTVDAPQAGPLPSPGQALCECATRGLPFGECGATPTDGSDPLFWNEVNDELACT